MAERTVVQRPERWDKPFDPEMSEARVDRILAMAPFDTMDPSSFPRSAPLRDIVRNDIRFRTFNDAEIIIRKGDFGTSAYLLVSGNALVVLPPGLSEATLGRSKFQKKTFFQGLLQLWNNPRGPEVRNPDLITAAPVNASDWVVGGDPDTAKLDLGKIRKTFKTLLIEPGSLFGEIAALSRSARTTTIIAEGTTEILEIRRQGIRDIRRCDKQFRENVDTLYRENSLSAHLGQTPIFAHLDTETIQMIAAKTLFETYGDFDWHISYNRMLSKPSQDRLAEEPLIVREGDYPDGLLLLRSGFARVSRRLNHGAKTVEYLSSGSTFGLPEIAHNWHHDTREPIGLQHSLRAVGYADILRVPTTIIEELVLPTIPDSMHPASVERRFLQVMPHKERRKIPQKLQSAAENQAVGLMESLVEYRYINGTAAMVIDLDRCIRCDACVEACAKGHNNNPRFVRHGRVFEHFMIANACMHCVDPVCMIGCPTGAIGRDTRSGHVVINDTTCIGCMTCASNCPYDNIRIVEARDKHGAFILDQKTNAPVAKATKCDLCVDQSGGPACVRACPHDALRRTDMGDFPALANWLSSS